MLSRRLLAILAGSLLCSVNGCSSSSGENDDDAATVPEFGAPSARAWIVVGTSSDGLQTPRDLDFDPLAPGRLWVVNARLGGVVIFDHVGEAGQTSQHRYDVFAPHFMNHPSSIAFGADGAFATCGETRDEWNGAAQPSDDFMGPTLWSSDLDVFAVVNQKRGTGKEGSHIDMLHESPLCMGIAHDRGNAYFSVDGVAGQIVRSDFGKDHGPGGTDHSNGMVRRYAGATLTAAPGIPSHVALDDARATLYVADTGGGRVMKLDVLGGTGTPLEPVMEPLAEYTLVEGASYTELAGGLDRPSGIAFHDGKIFVGEHGTGDIVAEGTSGRELGRVPSGAQSLMGIAFSPEGKLHFVDAATNRVVRLDPTPVEGASDRASDAPFQSAGQVCEAVDNDGPDVVEQKIPKPRPTSYSGGTLPDGKYHLTKIETFTGTRGEMGEGELRRRETYIVKNGTIVGAQRYVEGDAKDDHFSARFDDAGNKLRFAFDCFEGAGALRPASFDQTETGVVLYPAYVDFAWTWTRVGDP